MSEKRTTTLGRFILNKHGVAVGIEMVPQKSKSFRKLLVTARRLKKCSLREIERVTGISYGMISRYENGITEMSFRHAILLCDYYGLDLSLLANARREK